MATGPAPPALPGLRLPELPTPGDDEEEVESQEGEGEGRAERPQEVVARLPLWEDHLAAEASVTSGSTRKESAAEHSSNSRFSLNSKQHQVQGDPLILNCIKLMDARRFTELQSPVPRMQEVPEESFGVPGPSDIVVAVSHAWRNQGHPDPNGEKQLILGRCFQEIQRVRPERPIYLFFDFVSISQRPFDRGQEPRTEQEISSFQAALTCMHKMYFLSDYVVHLPSDEKSRVKEEGEERVVSAASLKAAHFMQVRDVVQVARPPGGDSEVQLFDQVLRVDAVSVTSAGELERMLPGASRVTVRRLPFGTANFTPADERGWIFLERFITMVKCAMMDEVSARDVVITPSPSILKQIIDGANRLRAAAKLKREAPNALKEELGHFNEELQTKRFSAVSLDREVATKGVHSKDRDVVCGIMTEFVGHLEKHWDAEAARQRSIARRLARFVAATEEKVFGDWDSFSPAHGQALQDAAKSSPWPALLLLVTPVYVMTPFLLPQQNPDDPWQKQLRYWCLILPWLTFNALIGFSCMIIKLSRCHCTYRVYGRLVVWAAGIAVFSTCLQLGIASYIDTFPVPFVGAITGVIGAGAAPLTYFCIEPAQRTSPGFRFRVLLSILGAMLLVGACGMPLLGLLAGLEHVALGGQVLLILGFFVTKLNFEVLGTKLAKFLGGDSMPIFLIAAIGFYQSALCFAFTRVSHWLIAVEQISFDAIENLYYLSSLRRRQESLTPQQLHYLITSLATRELLEILHPLQFGIGYFCFYFLNREMLSPFCKDDVFWTLVYLGLDLLMEVLISYLTWARLVRDGHAPFGMLKGLMHTEWAFLHLAGASTMGLFFGFHHANLGMDLSFQLNWLRDGYEWSCGLTWTAKS